MQKKCYFIIYTQELHYCACHQYINGLVQDCSNSSALAMELLQSCTKPLICDLYSAVLIVTLYIISLAQDNNNSIANVLELLQSHANPSIWYHDNLDFINS